MKFSSSHDTDVWVPKDLVAIVWVEVEVKRRDEVEVERRDEVEGPVFATVAKDLLLVAN